MSNNKIKDNASSENNFEFINLFEILEYFWKRKLIFIIFIILSIIYSSYVLRNSAFEYEVKLDVIPLNQNSGLAPNSFQNISKLLGINTKQIQPNLGLYRSLIKSNTIARVLAEDKEFLKLVSGSLWDEETNSLRPPTLSNISKIKKLIKKSLGIPVFEITRSNSSFIYRLLSKLEFRPAPAGLTEVIFQTSNPELGAKILLKAHSATEDFLKKRSIKKTLRNISFIDEKLSQPQKADHRLALIKILSDLQKTLMISSSDMPYAVEAFNDMPIVSDHPVSPNAQLTIILNATISILLSIIFIIILFIYNFRKRTTVQ